MLSQTSRFWILIYSLFLLKGLLLQDILFCVFQQTIHTYPFIPAVHKMSSQSNDLLVPFGNAYYEWIQKLVQHIQRKLLEHSQCIIYLKLCTTLISMVELRSLTVLLQCKLCTTKAIKYVFMNPLNWFSSIRYHESTKNHGYSTDNRYT